MSAVVIGSSREQKLPSLVLEYTLHKHASEPVDVIHTYDKKFPEPVNRDNRSRTGFSFARFAVPELVGYQGRAAYLECDQIVFRDIHDLLSIPFQGALVLRPPNQPSVLLMDCDHLRWGVTEIIQHLDAGQFTYKQLMEDLCVVGGALVSETIPNYWNSLEEYEEGKTALLHYTNMSGQPWRRWGHPLAHLWLNALLEAVRNGFISIAVVREEVRVKAVVPEVGRWIEEKV